MRSNGHRQGGEGGMRVNRGTQLLMVAAVAGWTALFWSMTPWAPAFDFEMGRLGVAVGPTCSVVLTLRRLALPILEVYEAGRLAGRREVELRPERRRLRVVDSD